MCHSFISYLLNKKMEFHKLQFERQSQLESAFYILQIIYLARNVLYFMVQI